MTWWTPDLLFNRPEWLRDPHIAPPRDWSPDDTARLRAELEPLAR